MRKTIAVFALTMGLAASASAALITTGTFSLMPVTPNDDGSPWFDNSSNDGFQHGLAHRRYWDGWSYLHATGDPESSVGFGWLGPLPDNFHYDVLETDWLEGAMTHDEGSGSFNFTTNGGRSSSSFGQYQMVLLYRQIETLEFFQDQYEIWVEDILFNDLYPRDSCRPGDTELQQTKCGDYNDGRAHWYVQTDKPKLPPVCLTDCDPPPVCIDCRQPPGNIPEPASMGMFGLGLYAVARRIREKTR